MKPAIEGGTPVRQEFLPFGRPQVTEEDIEAAVKVMRSGWLSTGPKVAEFEKIFAGYKGRPYALALSSCTAALHLSLIALRLKPGDEVITTAMTFAATVNTILLAGGTPVVVDVDRYTQNITAPAINEAVTERTKAVVVVHFAGMPCDMEQIRITCRDHKLQLIEDCAHAIETTCGNGNAGTFGLSGCFSFYGTKNITTAIGEGGMLICDNEDFYKWAKTASLHGMSKDAAARYTSKQFRHYDIKIAGQKYNMTDVAAAFAVSQLGRIEENWKKRAHIWRHYSNCFSDLPVVLPVDSQAPYARHAYHLYTLRMDPDALRASRDQILDAITQEGIGVGCHYTSIPEMSFYKEAGEKGKMRLLSTPNALWNSRRTISIPLDATLTEQDVDDVITSVRKVFTYYLA